MERINWQRTILILVALLVLLQTGIQVTLLLPGTAAVTERLTIDDTYYYLQTAWNTWDLGFPTFDGIHRTSGVQMLWYLVLLALVPLATGKTVFLFLVLSVCILLNAGCYLFILGIGRSLRSYPLAMLMAVLWFGFVVTGHGYVSGMENSLHALIIWALVWKTITILQSPPDRRRLPIPGWTVLLVLNVWTRIDALPFSLVIFTGVWLILSRRTGQSLFTGHLSTGFLRSTLLAAAGGITLGMGYFLMAGSLLPVSLLVKARHAGPEGLGAAAGAFLEGIKLSAPSLSWFIHPLTLSAAWVFMTVACLAVTAKHPVTHRNRLARIGYAALAGLLPPVLFLLFSYQAGILIPFILILATAAVSRYLPLPLEAHQGFLVRWRQPLLLLAGGFCLYQVVAAVSGVPQATYHFWYRAPHHVFWVVGFTFLALWAWRMIPANARVAGRRAGLTVLCLLTVTAAAGGLGSAYPRHPMVAAQYRTGCWLRANIPETEVLAAWNAGHVGYFSHRRVINLDGLINSVDYYRNLLKDSGSLPDYLRENRVSYIVDYCCVNESGIRSLLSPRHRIETYPGWKPITVWRFR